MIGIASLVPHAGAMVLLEHVEHWDAVSIRCRTRTHLDPANPLRRATLAPICGIEYGLQAAALHGALLARTRPRPGYVASLRAVTLALDRLDDPAIDPLLVHARLHAQEALGMLYDLELRSRDAILLTARATIAIPP